jgi:predicted TIM-barrel fold metal-dependent hydrolase
MTRIIDPHVHVWTHDARYPWAKETLHPPEHEATAEMLLDLMAANGVEKTVLVQPIQYRWDNRYTADMMKRYPDKFMGVCRVNPEDPAAPDHLSQWVEADGFHGVRLSPSVKAEGDWFTGPLMDPIFQRASELGVPMLILTGPSRLPDLAAILERHSDLDVVVDHMADASPSRPNEIEQVLALARYPRVFVKISHVWSISAQPYPWRDTWAMVKQVYQTFGPQRIMADTDWPVCLKNATYAQTLAVVRDEMDFFAPGDLDWVLGKTALRLWPFDKPA